MLGISLATAIFPVMSADAAKKDFNALCVTISRGLRGAVFVALPATVGLWLIGNPLVLVIFQRGQFTSDDTISTFKILCFYAFGLCGYFAQQIATRAFYSVQDSKTPAVSALIAVAVNIVLNLTLIWFIGTAGLALSTALCSYLQVVILVYVLRRKFGHMIFSGLTSTLCKSLAGVFIMTIIASLLLTIMGGLPDNLSFGVLRILIIVPSSAIVYILTLKMLKSPMLSLITGSVGR